MTEVAEGNSQKIAEKGAPLDADARALAEAHREIKRAPRLVTHGVESRRVARRLARAQKYFVAGTPEEAGIQASSEWFLDNYHLIRRVARQVEEDLPDGFVRHLPHLVSGTGSGRSRIEAFSRWLVGRVGLVLDLPRLRRFVDAYQQVSPLTIAELWALPAMLRATVLSQLVKVVRDLHVPIRAGLPRSTTRSVQKERSIDTASLDQATRTGVEQAIRALRVLDVIDWKAFFEKTSRVEAILRSDPSGIYA